MKTLLIYDSRHGNTKQIAQAVSAAIGSPARHVAAVQPADLTDCELLMLGSPTHGGFPSEAIHELLKASPALHGLHVAAFDTRTRTTIFGYAAPKIARGLVKHGGTLVVPPEGFFVLSMQGPLRDGELERAAEWAKALLG